MHRANSFPEGLSQNKQLSVRIVSPLFGHLSDQSNKHKGVKQRLPYYFFLFVIDGKSQCQIDMENFDLCKNDLLFALPQQIRHTLSEVHSKNYFKLGFDDDCLALLPRQYPFLVNPLNQQRLPFSQAAAERLRSIFEVLQSLLSDFETNAELILAHLNSLLVEINNTYFTNVKRSADLKLDAFIRFKIFVEANLTDQPAVQQIAEQLLISTDSLYQIVKQFSGLSPKAFLTHRLILEARRRLYYDRSQTVKELALSLGFQDPDYFSRLFKKMTGKTAAAFVRDLS